MIACLGLVDTIYARVARARSATPDCFTRFLTRSRTIQYFLRMYSVQHRHARDLDLASTREAALVRAVHNSGSCSSPESSHADTLSCFDADLRQHPRMFTLHLSERYLPAGLQPRARIRGYMVTARQSTV